MLPTDPSQRRATALGQFIGREKPMRLPSLASVNFPRLTPVARRASEIAGIGMFRRSSSSLRLLVAVLFGLNALCLASVAHGRQKVPQLSLTSRAPASGSESLQYFRAASVPTWDLNAVAAGSGSYVFDALGHLRHAPGFQTARLLRHANAPEPLFREARVAIANIAETLPARESALPLGDAPRARGPSRAPPVA